MVKKGRNPGIYNNWAECQKNVTGFSGAVYQGFFTLEEAENFMGKEDFQEKERKVLQEELEKKDGAIAYVDGSYLHQTKEFSYGVVIFYQGIEEQFKKKFSNDLRSTMRNVAGEIEGSMCAIKYCLEHKISSLTIYYDYEGIEKWCTGDWKATKEGTIAYRDFYKKAREKLEIQFVKVKGHSGNRYNDLADALAKEALGL